MEEDKLVRKTELGDAGLLSDSAGKWSHVLKTRTHSC